MHKSNKKTCENISKEKNLTFLGIVHLYQTVNTVITKLFKTYISDQKIVYSNILKKLNWRSTSSLNSLFYMVGPTFLSSSIDETTICEKQI